MVLQLNILNTVLKLRKNINYTLYTLNFFFSLEIVQSVNHYFFRIITNDVWLVIKINYNTIQL